MSKPLRPGRECPEYRLFKSLFLTKNIMPFGLQGAGKGFIMRYIAYVLRDKYRIGYLFSEALAGGNRDFQGAILPCNSHPESDCVDVLDGIFESQEARSSLHKAARDPVVLENIVRKLRLPVISALDALKTLKDRIIQGDSTITKQVTEDYYRSVRKICRHVLYEKHYPINSLDFPTSMTPQEKLVASDPMYCGRALVALDDKAADTRMKKCAYMKGITVCYRWRELTTFLSDQNMGYHPNVRCQSMQIFTSYTAWKRVYKNDKEVSATVMREMKSRMVANMINTDTHYTAMVISNTQEISFITYPNTRPEFERCIGNLELNECLEARTLPGAVDSGFDAIYQNRMNRAR